MVPEMLRKRRLALPRRSLTLGGAFVCLLRAWRWHLQKVTLNIELRGIEDESKCGGDGFAEVETF